MLATFAALVAFFSTLGLSERLAQHVNAPRVAALPGDYGHRRGQPYDTAAFERAISDSARAADSLRGEVPTGPARHPCKMPNGTWILCPDLPVATTACADSIRAGVDTACAYLTTLDDGSTLLQVFEAACDRPSGTYTRYFSDGRTESGDCTDHALWPNGTRSPYIIPGVALDSAVCSELLDMVDDPDDIPALARTCLVLDPSAWRDFQPREPQHYRALSPLPEPTLIQLARIEPTYTTEAR